MNSDPVHRARHHQLWIDDVRSQLEKAFSQQDFERTIKLQALARLIGNPDAVLQLATLSPDRLADEFRRYGLSAPPPVFALEALEARGYPQREMTITGDWAVCDTKVCAALNYCSLDILTNPGLQVMLLDDRTAKAVADSTNEPITAAELQHLPHNPCLIEFYRPVEIAESVKRGIRLRGVGFEAVGNAEVPAAVVGFYLDRWQSVPDRGTRWPATLGIWFGGFNIVTIDEAVRTQVGIAPGSDDEIALTETCRRVGRNLWDFVTMRTINYDRIRRKPMKHPLVGERPQHVQGLRSKFVRDVFRLYLTREASQSDGMHGRKAPPPGAHRVQVLGKFHELVYCAKCGDLHRHDLLGHACRKCGEVVGPRANVRVEKSWHPPYFMGPPDAPIKEVVHDVHRQKRR